MRILGIDPGSRATGFGVIDNQQGSLQFVACGVIRTGDKKELPERLKIIYDGLCDVIVKHEPTIAAVEDVFVSVNPRAALKLGQARGAAIMAAKNHDLQVYEYGAKMVKQSVVGYGQAAKGQIQQMVRILLNLTSSPSSDAADALAVAICHANKMF